LKWVTIREDQEGEPKVMLNLLVALLAAAALCLPALVRADPVADAVRAGVPAPLASEVAARAVERGVPPQQALAPVAEAAQRGLPPDLVATKVLEGLSKGVSQTRIAAAARDLTTRLATADEVLLEARRAGLAEVSDRRGALLDLGAALGVGIDRQALATLVAAARESRSGGEAVVSGAQVMSALSRQGVPVPQSMPLGLAIARKGPRPPGEIAALFESWRAEGGSDARGFVNEAARRVEQGRKLDDMVDLFGESPNHIVVDRGSDKDKDRQGLAGSDVGKHGADQGVGPAEPPGRAGGAVPGLDEAVRMKKGKGPKPKSD
jgi:hypothetical protein